MNTLQIASGCPRVSVTTSLNILPFPWLSLRDVFSALWLFFQIKKMNINYQLNLLTIINCCKKNDEFLVINICHKRVSFKMQITIPVIEFPHRHQWHQDLPS